MTIYIGSLVSQGGSVKLVPPLQFGSVGAIRLSNYTDFPVTVNNISGRGQSTEYLMPTQQNIYPTENVSTVPTVTPSAQDTVADVLAKLFVEWSTDPEHDFLGVYPAQLSIPADAVALAIFSQGVPTVLNTTLIEHNTNLLASSQNDVSMYGSLILFLIASITSTLMRMQIDWLSSASGVFLDENIFTIPTSSSVRPAATLFLPVEAPVFRLQNNDVGKPIEYWLYGTNRLIPSPKMAYVGNQQPPRRFQNNNAILAGVLTTLDSLDGGVPWTTFNGKVTISVFTSVASNIYMVFLDRQGNQQQISLGPTAAGANTVFSFAHPFSGIRWAVAPGVNMGAGGCVFSVLPELVA